MKSRLDKTIARMKTQRCYLDWAVAASADIAGPILEIGLGNGRTYSHLRKLCGKKEIFVFDRAIRAHPSCIPDAHHMIVGDVRDTLDFCLPRIGQRASLLHSDLGHGDETDELAIRHWLSPLVGAIMQPGGIVVANHQLDLGDAKGLDISISEQELRHDIYFLYRFGGA